MKHPRIFSLSILLIALLLLSACSLVSIASRDAVTGSGNVVSETRQVSNFSRLTISSSADVTVVLGDTEGLTIEAEDNLLPYITTEVFLGDLTIGVKLGSAINPTRPIRVTLNAKLLDGLRLNGSGSIDLPGIDQNGLDIKIGGSGNILVSGATDDLTITLGGSGTIDCRDLVAQTARVRLNGSGTITVNATEKIDAGIPGSGTIYTTGAAAVTESVTGSGSIQPLP